MTVERNGIFQSLKSKKSDLISGGISGLLTGIILGVISVPANYFLLSYFSTDIRRSINGYEPTLSGVVSISIGTIILVLCIGVLYGLIHDLLPGNTGFSKILIFGVLIFAVTTLNDYFIDFHLSAGLFYAETILDIVLLMVLLPLLMARFFDRLLLRFG